MVPALFAELRLKGTAAHFTPGEPALFAVVDYFGHQLSLLVPGSAVIPTDVGVTVGVALLAAESDRIFVLVPCDGPRHAGKAVIVRNHQIEREPGA
jgi:hypothetical protein